MDGSFKPPNVFDDDDDDLYTPSTVDKGKRKADGICHIDARLDDVSDLYPDSYNDTSAWAASGSSPTTDVGGYSLSIGSSSDSSSMDLDDPSVQFTTYSDSESTVSMAKGYTDRRDASQLIESDDDDDSFQSFYESVNSDLPSLSTDDKVSGIQCRQNVEANGSQMDVDELHNLQDNLDLACSITGLYRILDLITEQGSGGLGNALCRGQHILAHTFPSRQDYNLSEFSQSLHQHRSPWCLRFYDKG